MLRRCLLITAAATCIAYLINLLNRPPSLHTDFSKWQRLFDVDPSTRDRNNYEAPLYLYEEPSRILNHYFVFLHFGYTLEQHKQAVGNGTDLDSAITYVFLETETHGPIYVAELHDAGLAAVRADVAVDMVECDVEVFIIE